MKKQLILAAIATTMILGGSITAMASNPNNNANNNDSPVSPSHMGEYWHENDAIIKAWENLSNETKQLYLDNPELAPINIFPFGIDVENQAPIGYPTCLESDEPASYAPTMILPNICNANDDNGHPEN